MCRNGFLDRGNTGQCRANGQRFDLGRKKGPYLEEVSHGDGHKFRNEHTVDGINETATKAILRQGKFESCF